ncbi:FAD-binding oxidoreductase [Spelaeicoccus albus]|uniref:FAD-binding PCMH-type domain-containing protein n=1 Tax=Spelaeicoccus albus TaxID=1280376 RepID=A0A7Z0D337_9MICO|nr:FAD-binding oxidoreductase [Spelaeicoccus albus]NYI67989.1 hypothetical protein [Spelaeicoccus albus]
MPTTIKRNSAGAESNDLGAGAVYRNEPEFAAAVAGFNTAASMQPDVVVPVWSTGDIRRVVEYAAGIGAPVTVQATGHGYTYPVSSGILIDTSGMRGVDIDVQAGTATVQAGARWSDVHAAAGRHGLAGLVGSSSDIGVVGFCLGGGFPILGRTYGFASDRILAAELVTGDGVLHHVDSREPELLWALQGGKANVGIVASLTIELVHLHRVFGGGIFFPGESAAAVVHEFARWAPTLPVEAGTSIALLRLPADPSIPEPLRGQFVVHLRFAFTGPAEDGDELVAPMRAVSPAIFDQVGDMPYADIDAVHSDPRDAMPYTEGGVLLGAFPEEAATALIEAAGPDSDATLPLVEVRLMGGAYGVGTGAVNGRGSEFFASVVALIGGTQLPEARDEIDRIIGALRPWATGSAVNLNGPAATRSESAALWSPDTVRRLSELRRVHDPAGIIRAGHTV